MIRSFFLCFCISSQILGMEQQPNMRHIVFDLDSLFDIDPFKTSNSLLTGFVKRLINPDLVSATHTKLIEAVSKLNSKTMPECYVSMETRPTYKNIELPHYWCLYLIGLLTSDDITKPLEEHISKSFTFAERPLVKAAASISFNPEEEAKVMIPKGDITKILEALSAIEQNKMYLLTNKRRETLEALQTTFPALFKLFEGRIHASGITGRLKPNKDAFENFFTAYNLLPESCLFVEIEKQYEARIKQLNAQCLLLQEDASDLENHLKTLGFFEPLIAISESAGSESNSPDITMRKTNAGQRRPKATILTEEVLLLENKPHFSDLD